MDYFDSLDTSAARNICPTCGKEMIKGVCLSCDTGRKDKEAAVREPCGEAMESIGDDAVSKLAVIRENDTSPLPAPPEEHQEPRESENPYASFVPLKKADVKSEIRTDNANPYASMRPYDKPDYGEIYGEIKPTDKVGKGEETLTHGMKIKEDTGNPLDYWYIVVPVFIIDIFLSLRIPLSLIVGIGLTRFDGKGARRAGLILMGAYAVKFLAAFASQMLQ
ncbi:MAG: hypothetical protein ACI4KF_06680 [Huintestinicola sp.]